MIEPLERLPAENDYTTSVSADESFTRLRDKLNQVIYAVNMILAQHPRIKAEFENSL